jgi:hypothetical protein
VDILKLFYEEPLYLETLTHDADPDARRRSTRLSAIDALLPGDFGESPGPRAEDDFSADALDRPTPYYRLYLSGADLGADRSGLTAVRQPGTWSRALLASLPGERWWALTVDGLAEIPAGEVPALLADPSGVPVIAVASGEPLAQPLRSIAETERREAFPDLKRLLSDGVTTLIREPAHDGYDWHVFSPAPLKDEVVGALAAEMRSAPDTRIFAVPYRQARSEHKFYFERWALDDLPGWVEEIRPAGG